MPNPKASPVGKMNRRPIFYNWTYSQDAGAGSSQVETERWPAWAEIKDRTGNKFAAQATDLQQYDYRVRVRFDARFNSNTWMIYEGQVCKLESLTVESEGYKNFFVLRYSKTETYVDLS